MRRSPTCRRAEPHLAERLRLQFVGSSNNRAGHADYRVRGLAAAQGVGDLVVETPQRVAYLDALGLVAQSQGILLIGSDEPHYTASKIYPVLMSGIPYLSLYHAASSAHDILRAPAAESRSALRATRSWRRVGPC